MDRSPASLRVGLIGAGGISAVHAAAWHHLGATVLVYSRDGAGQLAAQYGFEAVPSLAELWDRVDVVDIVTPTPTHHDFTLEAIERGKHVVCEKPLARTGAQADEMVRAAARAGVQLFPGHVVRYFPEYARARESVSAGRIGTVATCRFRRVSAAPGQDWFFDEAASGGIVMDQMIHDIDQAELFAGPVTEVFARSVAGTGSSGPVASAAVTLRHAGGAISQCYGVWGPAHLPFGTSFLIAGDGGILGHDSATDDSVRVMTAPTRTDGGYLPPGDGASSPYTTQIADFATCLTSGAAPRVTAADGARAIHLAEAALASIREQAPVAVPAPESLEVS